MALKDMWIPTEFRAVFPKGLLLLGDIEPQTEFSEDRSAPKRQAQDYDREGNGSGKRLWKATVMDRSGGKASQAGFDITFVSDQMPVPSEPEVMEGLRPIELEGLLLKPRVVGNGQFKSIGFYIRATGIVGDNSGAKVPAADPGAARPARGQSDKAA
ncbi:MULTISPECIES: hypothetical protein [Nocardia]|uniref:hypothetical protein n=1 Tax=Nocardia TaxID=1817 RepID=UPI0007EA8AE1|nr:MULTISPECIES: hypothetical protein [Nocardia]MBF6272162.1 hypothetical protein [Nocardia nova]OBA50887.1 hypothetical protein A5789_28275 [Nocardia sp. 852002-51101_SCH5132738]OBB50780.1 hypothetical protein A5748_17770 [Nocardia sp. 852002-51244_SCH5132740]OBF76073.1 hypothetical protein A9X06_25235 [Mycobacterium sp. 852002-51759_SCH5129042]